MKLKPAFFIRKGFVRQGEFGWVLCTKDAEHKEVQVTTIVGQDTANDDGPENLIWFDPEVSEDRKSLGLFTRKGGEKIFHTSANIRKDGTIGRIDVPEREKYELKTKPL
jgi:hypothetical protein